MTTNLITAKPKNYLNNKDILSEIHTSKTSYCSFLDKEYHKYDLIIDISSEDIKDKFTHALSPESIAQAKENRASRLSTAESKITSESIATEDLVFRIMMWDHIPLATKQSRKVDTKKTAKDILDFEDDDFSDLFSDLEDIAPVKNVNDMTHVKLNFPPFQHFKINENGEFYCVGKSHWKGDLNDGEFSKDHGSITNKLAKMYMMMCEKYALKYNWRGYTYRDEMQNSAILQLTYVGLRFNESKSNNPFAYYTAAITNAFCRVLNTEKRSQTLRDDILEMSGLNPSWSRMSIGGSYED